MNFDLKPFHYAYDEGGTDSIAPGYMIVETTMNGVDHVVIAKDDPKNFVHCPVRGNLDSLHNEESPIGVYQFVRMFD